MPFFKPILCSLMAGLSLSLLLPSAAQAAVERMVGQGRLNWSEGTLTVTGTGATNGQGNLGQQRLLAQRAAVADAYRQLAEAVNGVQVFAETTVKDFVTESDIVRLQVKAVIRGARIKGQTRYMSDGTVEVDVEMPVYGRSSLAEAVQLGQAMEQQLERPFSSLERYLAYRGYQLPAPPQPEKPDSRRGLRLAQNYTGLIVDAAGLGADPVMVPFIVSAGTRVHPNHEMNVDPNLVVQQGPLHYVDSMEAAMADEQRVGSNPLVIKAKAAIGDPIHSNILLDKATALKVLDLNQENKFLDALRVTLVL